MDNPRRFLLEALHAAIQAVHGQSTVRDWLQAHPCHEPVHVIAFGKAACAMVRGAHEALGSLLVSAFIVTKHGHAEPLPWPVLEAGHPLPDARSLAAGEALHAYVRQLPAAATVLVLISGGASALVEQLPAGCTLADLQRLNSWLLGSGLDIHAMNGIRKRLSRIKGGRLARRLAPRTVLGLVISDVPGDDLRAIGSGPLTPDPRALAMPDLPPDIRDLLAQAPPLPATDDPCFERVQVHVIASNADARRAALAACRRGAVVTAIDAGLLTGDAVRAGTQVAQAMLAATPGAVMIWGGETTVTLPAHPGRGGRCQSLALSAALTMAGQSRAWLLAAGTDGADGPGEDAGALVDGETILRGREEGFNAPAALDAADAGRFLEASGDLLQTGPTGTNVMDLVIGLRL